MIHRFEIRGDDMRFPSENLDDLVKQAVSRLKRANRKRLTLKFVATVTGGGEEWDVVAEIRIAKRGKRGAV